MQSCTTCSVSLPTSDFERYRNKGSETWLYRKECKQCRKSKRGESSQKKAATIDKAQVAVPECCVKCGAQGPSASFTWRSDTNTYRTTCTKCHAKNSEGVPHYKIHRDKQIAEDREGTLKHRARVHLKWAHTHPDNVARQDHINRTDPVRRMKRTTSNTRCQIRKSVRKHHPTLEASDVEAMVETRLPATVNTDQADVMASKHLNPCHYCGYEPPEGQPLNGLDRVDPNGKYEDANTVACCMWCNAVKLKFHVDEFLDNVRNIAIHRQFDVDACARIARPQWFGTIRHDGTSKVYKDESSLPLATRVALWSGPCYLCGRGPAFGIDRVDSSGGYAEDNCRSCCTSCNYMKKNTPLDRFMGHVSRIYKHTCMWVLGDASFFLHDNSGPRQPVAVGGLLFPSRGCALKVLGTTQGLRKVPVSVYKSQHVTQDACTAFVRKIRNM